MNNEEHKAKHEGLKNQYENRLSSVKVLDQSILNITDPDDYENELIEPEEHYDNSFELLAKISELNRIPLTIAYNSSDNRNFTSWHFDK